MRIIPAYAGSTPHWSPERWRQWDHPRIRGEHFLLRHGAFVFPGSSPHTRGAPGGPGRHPRQGGIIPAYAGSTCRPGSGRRRRPDHPRIRGEHLHQERMGVDVVGSSPHTRGARPAPRHQPRRGRIIPAYAGSTGWTFPGRRRCKDHPRIRGEHLYPRERPGSRSGSSPHTRGAPDGRQELSEFRRIIPAYAGSTGTLRLSYIQFKDHPRIRGEHVTPVSRCLGVLRIIPAYAGSTQVAAKMRLVMPDHPRIRGEHSSAFLMRISIEGSSPHTRGAPTSKSSSALPERIIPAYAGSTAPRPNGAEDDEDHPRIRGEHIVAWMAKYENAGSSPHTRGARLRTPPRPRPRRIIPAYAGSTSSTSSPGGSTRDHPRIRGEHGVELAIFDDADGSSPHTRGAPFVDSVNQVLTGIIPAYAGSTIAGLGRIIGGVGSSPHTRGARPAPRRSRRPSGSSPHTRGARVVCQDIPLGPGIIPAYAGSTVHWPPLRWRQWDHPRIRGEHVHAGYDVEGGRGIIPAYAGSTRDCRL